jgi:co-chaperonin GroES (HSP10)
LHVPAEAQRKTCRGVIMAAGCQARDSMKSHGHLIGDRVVYPRYSGVLFPWEGDKEVALMPVKDILANVDLRDRIKRGLMEYVFDSDNQQHSVQWAGEPGESKAQWDKVKRSYETKESA